MVLCLKQSANDLHGPADATATPIISCSSKIQNGLPFYGADPGRPGKKAVKRCSSSSEYSYAPVFHKNMIKIFCGIK